MTSHSIATANTGIVTLLLLLAHNALLQGIRCQRPELAQACAQKLAPSCAASRGVAMNSRFLMASLLNSCLVDNATERQRPLRFLAPQNGVLGPMLAVMNRSYAASVRVEYTALGILAYVTQRPTLLRDRQPPNATRGYDLILVTATAFGDAAQVPGKLPDLSYQVAEDPYLDWRGIPPQFRDAGAMYDNAIRAIPFLSAPYLLYYRLDVFQRDNLAVPQTWEELADLAERYHGREGMVGACIMSIGCRAESLILRTIYGSYVQTSSPSQGMFWDVETLEPLVNTPAMAAALTVFRRLRHAGPTASDAPACQRQHFSKGQCLMALGDGSLFKTGSIGPPDITRMRGNMGFAPMPGSSRVLDRTTRELVPCDAVRCPTARGVSAEGLPVNRPIAMGSIVLMVNGLATPQQQLLGYQLAAYLASPAIAGIDGLLLEPNELLPIREEDMSLAHVHRWAARGYDASDVIRFLTAYQQTTSNPNVNVDLKLIHTSNVTDALLAAAVTFNNASTDPASLPQVLRQMEDVLHWIVEAEGGKQGFAPPYRRSINWVQEGREYYGLPTSTPPHEGSTLVTAIAVPCSVVMLLLGGVLLLLQRWRELAKNRAKEHARKTFMAPPEVGPQTTLVLTDIEDSTVLWEHMSEVMNEALDVHNGVVRELVVVHKGYECLTEGDSFVLAFHRSTHALAFLLDLQQALLDARWPPELLKGTTLLPSGVEGSPASITMTRQATHSLTSAWHPGGRVKLRQQQQQLFSPFPTLNSSIGTGGATPVHRTTSRPGPSLQQQQKQAALDTRALAPASGRSLESYGSVRVLASQRAELHAEFGGLSLVSPLGQGNQGQQQVDGVERVPAMSTVQRGLQQQRLQEAAVHDMSGDSRTGGGLNGGERWPADSLAFPLQSSSSARGPISKSGSASLVDVRGEDAPAPGASLIAGTTGPAELDLTGHGGHPTEAHTVQGLGEGWDSGRQQQQQERSGHPRTRLLSASVAEMAAAALVGHSRQQSPVRRFDSTSSTPVAQMDLPSLHVASGLPPPSHSQQLQPPLAQVSPLFPRPHHNRHPPAGWPGNLKSPATRFRSGLQKAISVTAWMGLGPQVGQVAPEDAATAANGGTAASGSQARLPAISAAGEHEFSGEFGPPAVVAATHVTVEEVIRAQWRVELGKASDTFKDNSGYGATSYGLIARSSLDPAFRHAQPGSNDSSAQDGELLTAGDSGAGQVEAAKAGAVLQGLEVMAGARSKPSLAEGGGGATMGVTSSSKVLDGARSAVPAAARSARSVAGTLVFRGLRVRAGMSCGVLSETDIVRVSKQARVQYSGTCMRLAKIVSDAALGGMTLLSESARSALEQARDDELAAVMKRHQPVLMWMGHHQLAPDLPGVHLYQIASQQLLPRMALLLQRPLRSSRGAQPPLVGVIGAPVFQAAAAQLTVSGASTLLAWDADIAGRALNVLHEALLDTLRELDVRAYVVEGAVGLLGNTQPAITTAEGAPGAAASRGISSCMGVYPHLDISGHDCQAPAHQECCGEALAYGARISLDSMHGGADPVVDQTSTELGCARRPLQLMQPERTSNNYPPVQPAVQPAVQPLVPEVRPHNKTGKELPTHGRPGVFTVVFENVDAAATFLLTAMTSMPLLEWPPSLLEHPLCEPMDLTASMATGVHQGLQEANWPVGAGSQASSMRREVLLPNILSSSLGSRAAPRRFLHRSNSSNGSPRFTAVDSADLASPSALQGDQRSSMPARFRASSMLASEFQPRLFFSGLRAGGAIISGDLGGSLPPPGNLSGHMVYRGKAWTLLNILAKQAQIGQVYTNMATHSQLRPEVAVMVKVARST